MLETLGSLAGGLLGKASDVLGAPRKFLFNGLNTILPEQMQLPEEGTEFFGRMGLDRENPLTKALGFGYEMATDPMTFFGGALARGAGNLIKGSGLAPMLRNRRQFSALKNMQPVGETGSYLDDVQNVVGASSPKRMVSGDSFAGKITGQKRRLDAESMVDSVGSEMRDKGLDAAYDSVSQTAYTPKGAPKGAGRHEMMHGIVDQAGRSGDTAGLPLGMRVSANLRSSDSPILRALGIVADETNSHLNMHKDWGSGLREVSNFFGSPHPHYVAKMREHSPLIANLYRNGPLIAKSAALAGAAGVPTSAGVYYGMTRGKQ